MLHCTKPGSCVTVSSNHCIKSPNKRTLTAQNGQVRGENSAKADQKPEASASGFFVGGERRPAKPGELVQRINSSRERAEHGRGAGRGNAGKTVRPARRRGDA